MSTNSGNKPGRPVRKIEYHYLSLGTQRLRVLTARLDVQPDELPLLIFNGIGASAELLEPLIAGLDRPVVTFDLPGIGGSSTSVMPRRMNQLATMAAQVLDELGLSRVDVMGMSWGGGLAQQFARQYDERCASLILAATATGHLMIPPRLRAMIPMLTPLRYFSSAYFRCHAGDIYGGDFRSDKALVSRHAKKMSPPSITGYYHQVYALAGWTSLFWLHQIRQRTLVLAGEDDPIIRLENARILADRIPDSTLKVFDCGHMFILTRLQQTVDAIKEFLADRDHSARALP